MLSQRVITATILGILFLCATFYLPHPWLAGVFGVIVILAAAEWAALTQLKPGARVAWMLLIGALLLLAWRYDRYVADYWLALGVVWWCIAGYRLIWGAAGVEPRGLRIISGIFVLVPAWMALVMLHRLDVLMFVVLFALVWTADTGAYFVGRKWGRRRLAAHVSPGKTIEGSVGGVILAAGLSAGVAVFTGFTLPQGMLWISLCIATVGFSILGDLWESKMKRSAGVKDSGAVLPGHGGILDRIDSVTAAAPVFASGLLIGLW